MALTTIRPDAPAVNPLAALQLDAEALNTPAAKQARLAGLLEAKAEAHANAGRLARWARPLAVATTVVSGVHLWETLAAVKPSGVAALSLPDAVYHGSALALVAVIDSAIIFLSASGNAAAYAGHTQRSRALPLLYAITGGLNFAFLAAHWPALPEALRGAVLPALAVLFPILLAVLVPALLVALEHAAHTLTAARLALGVEVATLRGLVAEGAQEHPAPATSAPGWGGAVLVAQPSASWARELPAQLFYPAPEPAQVVRTTCEAPQAPQTAPEAPAVPSQAVTETYKAAQYECPNCTAPLSLGAYGSAVRRGYCKACKPS